MTVEYSTNEDGSEYTLTIPPQGYGDLGIVYRMTEDDLINLIAKGEAILRIGCIRQFSRQLGARNG